MTMKKIMIALCVLHAASVFTMNSENNEERTQEKKSISEEHRDFLAKLEAARAQYNEKDALKSQLKFARGPRVPQSLSFNAARF